MNYKTKVAVFFDYDMSQQDSKQNAPRKAGQYITVIMIMCDEIRYCLTFRVLFYTVMASLFASPGFYG